MADWEQALEEEGAEMMYLNLVQKGRENGRDRLEPRSMLCTLS